MKAAEVRGKESGVGEPEKRSHMPFMAPFVICYVAFFLSIPMKASVVYKEGKE